MRRLALAIALVLVASVARAIDRTIGVTVRVELAGSVAHEGRAHFKKDAIEVETGRGTVKVAWRDVAALDEVDPQPPSEQQVAKDKLDYEARAKDVKEGDAAAWTKLGAWAKRHGLGAEAKAAFEKAIAITPDDAEARAGLGQVKEDGAWLDARDVYAKRRSTYAYDDAKLVELSRFAAKAGLDEEAIDAVRPIALKDPFRKEVIAVLKPVIAHRRPQTELRFPLHGRWRVSSDPTHHHEQKAYAIYAVDLNEEDADGKLYSGEGKKLEDWFSWGRPILAAEDGVVAEVREGHPDNPIGKIGPEHNGVSITHASGEQTWYIHCQKGSITVKVGDKVKRGDVIAKVGNSGASGAPHLHFTLVERGISVPWRCSDYTLITEDGSKVHVKRGRPTEGQRVESE